MDLLKFLSWFLEYLIQNFTFILKLFIHLFFFEFSVPSTGPTTPATTSLPPVVPSLEERCKYFLMLLASFCILLLLLLLYSFIKFASDVYKSSIPIQTSPNLLHVSLVQSCPVLFSLASQCIVLQSYHVQSIYLSYLPSLLRLFLQSCWITN